MTFGSLDIYDILEPLLNDYRKLRYRAMGSCDPRFSLTNADGSYSIMCIDEFVDKLLTEERVCDIQLPRLTQRRTLEETEALPRRKSTLGKAMGVGLGLDSDLSDSEDEQKRALERANRLR